MHSTSLSQLLRVYMLTRTVVIQKGFILSAGIGAVTNLTGERKRDLPWLVDETRLKYCGNGLS